MLKKIVNNKVCSVAEQIYFDKNIGVANFFLEILYPHFHIEFRFTV